MHSDSGDARHVFKLTNEEIAKREEVRSAVQVAEQKLSESLRSYNETLKGAKARLQTQIDIYIHYLRVVRALMACVDSRAEFEILHARMHGADAWEREPVVDSELVAQLRDAAVLVEPINVHWPDELRIELPRWEEWFDVC